MRLSASNIAWPEEADARVTDLMARLGFEGLEVAPTRIWKAPLSVTASEIKEFRARWERRNIRVVAMQALLFGRPDLTIFQSEEKRDETRRYLERMIELGSALGASVLIFGSPRNRSIAGVDPGKVDGIARAFFGAVGDYAARHDLCFCIEPNPAEYACDYVTDVAAAEALVGAVGSPGFGLHIDAGGMSMVGEPIEATIRRVGHKARHFHISEAHLAPVGSGSVDHRRMASALVAIGYDRWLSVEMRTPDGPDSFACLESALEYTVECYAAAATRKRAQHS